MAYDKYQEFGFLATSGESSHAFACDMADFQIWT